MLPSRSSVTRLFGIRQIFRREPEIERMVGHQVEREARRDRRRAGLQRLAIQLADEGDVAHRILPVIRAEVEIIHRKRLLEHRWIRAFRNRHQHRIDMPHVVTADDVGAIGEAARVLVIRRAQQQRRGIDGAAGRLPRYPPSILRERRCAGRSPCSLRGRTRPFPAAPRRHP